MSMGRYIFIIVKEEDAFIDALESALRAGIEKQIMN